MSTMNFQQLCDDLVACKKPIQCSITSQGVCVNLSITDVHPPHQGRNDTVGLCVKTRGGATTALYAVSESVVQAITKEINNGLTKVTVSFKDSGCCTVLCYTF